MSDLKPCPFCGGKARHYAPGPIDHHIECINYKDCGADIARDTEAEAIAAWNERAPVEYDGWFYLPKPKESVVEYGEPCIRKTENGYKAQQQVEVIESAIRSWGDELGEYVMKRICETMNSRAERTCEIVYKGDLWWECQSCGEQMRTIKSDPSYCPNCGCKAVGE